MFSSWSKKKIPTVHSLRFINDNKHFLVCTEHGFFVCDSEKGEKKIQQEIPGGVSLCESYKNSNIFFLVGTGEHVDFPKTKLVLWDSKECKKAGEVQFSLSE